MAKHYLNVQLDKKYQTSFIGKTSSKFSKEQIAYAAADVEFVFPLMEAQIAELEKKNLRHIAELEFEVSTVVAAMELSGVPIDKEMWMERIREYAKEHEESRQKVLSILFDTPIDKFEQQLGIFEDSGSYPAGIKYDGKLLNSPDQLKSAFRNLGIDLDSTKEEEIALIDHPAAEELINYRGLQKLISSYGEKSVLDKIHPFTGRIHPEWKQVGTETGRFSCKDPNMQQIPEKLRACVGGVDNWVVLGSDFSQMELRILAQESKDPILVDAFQTGKDIHTTTACTLFNLKPENVTKEQRFAAKTLNFGITYGMGVSKFENMMNAEAKKEGRSPITTEEAWALIDKYKLTYKTANRYLEQQGLFALREGFVSTRFGRKRFFKPPQTNVSPKQYKAQVGAVKRAGANMGIQGCNADITKIAMANIYQELREYGFRANIILQVHDEIGLLTHKSQVDIVQPIVVDAMVKAGEMILPDIPIKVESYTSEYWAK